MTQLLSPDPSFPPASPSRGASSFSLSTQSCSALLVPTAHQATLTGRRFAVIHPWKLPPPGASIRQTLASWVFIFSWKEMLVPELDVFWEDPLGGWREGQEGSERQINQVWYSSASQSGGHSGNLVDKVRGKAWDSAFLTRYNDADAAGPGTTQRSDFSQSFSSMNACLNAGSRLHSPHPQGSDSLDLEWDPGIW